MRRHHSSDQHRLRQKSWAELLCFGCTCIQLFWGRVVLRKWLNLPAMDSDYSADTESEAGSDVSDDEFFETPRKESRFKTDQGGTGRVVPNDVHEVLPQLRRRKSETSRAQYINNKEIKICAATWNVSGKMPPDDLDIDGWLDINDPADIYVVGFQEIIPLNAGNIFGAEDSRPIPKWENIIRETLDKIQPENKFKCYSDPPSPSKFKPFEDAPDIEDELILESDSDGEEEIYPMNEEFTSCDEVMNGQVITENEILEVDLPSNKNIGKRTLQRQFSSGKRLDRLHCLRTENDKENADYSSLPTKPELTRTLSGTEKLGFSWPEPQMHLLTQRFLERPNSFKSIQSYRAAKTFQNYNSFKYSMTSENRRHSDITLLTKVDLESLIKRKRRSPYVRIASKQMVGIFIGIWVRRNLRKHIQNVNVSTVGVGAMGYIGNKGSISVSMTVYQTLICFICTHLSSGEKEADLIKRNADVQEIHRRTHFNSLTGLAKSIYDHEQIIWLGDLNYRINLPYEKTKELISRKDWSQLRERDQLIRELRKGRAFDGWSEGILSFAPTYKYEMSADKYVGDDPKVKRTPAWCDRILSYGKGIRLMSYRRSELKFSDHRPVTASFMVEVEVFSQKKLQRALTFTNAEIKEEPLITDTSIDSGMGRLIFGEDLSYWQR